jgi:hypothetical protein
LIEATGTGPHVDLNNAVFEDGHVDSSGGGVIRVLAGGGTLWGYSSGGGLGLILDGTVGTDNGTTLSLVNTINNTGQIENGGHGASLTLSGATITSLAAKVALSGAGSVMETGGGTLLEASLTTIAAGGNLELLNGRSWASALSLTDNARLQLSGGTLAAAGLTVGAAGTVSAVGTLAAPTTDDGLVQAYRGVLAITGDVTGTGTLKIFGSSSLEIGGGLASTVDVLFGTGTHEILKLDQPAGCASTLTNWSYGDTIDLVATDATSAQINGHARDRSLRRRHAQLRPRQSRRRPPGAGQRRGGRHGHHPLQGQGPGRAHPGHGGDGGRGRNGERGGGHGLCLASTSDDRRQGLSKALLPKGG